MNHGKRIHRIGFILSLTLLFLIGCAYYKYLSQRSYLAGKGILKVIDGDSNPLSGFQHLKLERRHHPAVDAIVNQNGLPDYINIPKDDFLSLIYLEKDTVFEFKESGVEFRLLESHLITQALIMQLSEEDKKRYQLAKGKKLAPSISSTQVPPGSLPKRKPIEAPSSSPLVPTSLAPSALPKVIYIAADTANIRSGPGEKYEVVAKGHYGERLSVINEEKNWYQVELKDGVKGWVVKSLTARNKPKRIKSLKKTSPPVPERPPTEKIPSPM